MPNLMTDKNHLRCFFYDSSDKLKIRLLTWEKYGQNKTPFLSWVRQTIPITSGTKSLLDVGCGTGNFLKEVVDIYPDLKVSGIDLSQAMVDETKRKLSKLSNVIVGDAESLPFEGCSFSTVSAIHMLYHVQNQEKALREIVRVAEKGGVVFVTTTDYDVATGLNKLHYEGLALYGFPSFMQNAKSYLRFTPKKAAKLISHLKLSFEIFIYQNDVHFPTIETALNYYQSAMMHRQSLGHDDKRVDSKKWSLLYDYVRNGISAEIKNKSYFYMPGKVVGFRISL